MELKLSDLNARTCRPKIEKRLFKEDRRYLSTYDNFMRLEASEHLGTAAQGMLGEDAQKRAIEFLGRAGFSQDNSGSWIAKAIRAMGYSTFTFIEAHASLYADGQRQHFLLGKDLVSDLSNTSLRSVTPEHIPLPFPYFYIHLPKDAIKDSGGCIAYIAVAAFSDDVHFADGSQNRRLLISAGCYGGENDGMVYSVNTHFDRTILDTLDVFPSLGGVKSVSGEMAGKIMAVLVGACVYMNKPGTKEYKHAVTASQRTGHGNKLWSLRMVGEKYVAAKPHPMGGTHASPVMHLRRGHIRRVVDKVIWVRPCFVNAIE